MRHGLAGVIAVVIVVVAVVLVIVILVVVTDDNDDDERKASKEFLPGTMIVPNKQWGCISSLPKENRNNKKQVPISTP